ncbi:UDP-glucose 4-epimerase [Faunimonas pinastri]|uniref:UDP-glucose 4-epimerase n=1 Tax=Faunimonas pinastri TaxID=1855383 RepID=A0A1H9MH83_9HYPH|nr:UDP-glucose 4-epimerase GalE [Faunimonas pinastri]SER22891.1 UDP-glucose 4-epimerase [Faunimonas pinastri]
MTVLVTGGAGYIGSHAVLALIEAGRQVVVLDDLSTGSRDLVPRGATLVEGDVGDEALVGKLIREQGIDAILHFAGSIVVPDSVADPLFYYLNNTVKSRSLIAAAVAGGVKHFIFSSTAAVYGEPEASPVDETTRPGPISPYGSSKLMTEMMLSDTAFAHDFRFVALRYFNVAGADPLGRTGQTSPRATHLIKVALQAVRGERTHLEIYGTDYPTPDGTCLRDYIHVSDLADAHVLALAHLERGGESQVLNCGYGQGYSVLDVVAAVKRVAGVDFRVDHAPRRAGDPANLITRSEKIRAVLGWEPRHADLDVIVGHALAWEDSFNAREKTRAVG